MIMTRPAVLVLCEMLVIHEAVPRQRQFRSSISHRTNHINFPMPCIFIRHLRCGAGFREDIETCERYNAGCFVNGVDQSCWCNKFPNHPLKGTCSGECSCGGRPDWIASTVKAVVLLSSRQEMMTAKFCPPENPCTLEVSSS